MTLKSHYKTMCLILLGLKKKPKLLNHLINHIKVTYNHQALFQTQVIMIFLMLPTHSHVSQHSYSRQSVLFCKKSLINRYLLLSNWLPTVLTFILVTIIGALDFWTVKNVTGRLLVGLRWWSSYD